MNNYSIHSTLSFEKEFEQTYNYIAFELKDPIAATNFFDTVINKIYSLQYFPKRYKKINIFSNKYIEIRQMPIDNYIVVYEINNKIKQIDILHIFHGSRNYFNLI